jgi:hypothetical protein
VSRQDIERRFGSMFLENICEFVAAEYGISDLDKEKEALDYVRENFRPDEVFSAAELENWADANGYDKVQS